MSTCKAFVHALRDPALAVPAGLASWNGSDLSHRFAVYRNNGITALLSALADGFPVLQQLLGEDFFRELARRYVHANPPASPALFEYGESLPEFIAAAEPLRPYPYLADVARLEYLRTRAWHAADAQALSTGQFEALLQAPETLGTVRFTTHPSMQLLRSAHAVFDIWLAHQHAAAPSGFNTVGAQSVLVLRPADAPEVSLLSEGEACLLAALAAGLCLGDALASGVAAQPGLEIASALATLIRSQCLCAIHQETDFPP